MAEKRTRYITPKGVAMFPWLNKADTKFKAEGEYRVKVRIAEADAQPLIDKLQALYDEAIKAAITKRQQDPKQKGKKVKLQEQDFYSKVVDENGDETGEVEFNFKRTASGVSKKTNEPWAIKPDLFDAKGKPLSPDARVFGGSIVKVSFEVVPYDTPKATGIKLSLAAVQVLKLVEGTRDAGQYGFGDESEDDDADSTSDDSAAGAEGSGDDTGSGDEF
jgi:hypothetical protein